MRWVGSAASVAVVSVMLLCTLARGAPPKRSSSSKKTAAAQSVAVSRSRNTSTTAHKASERRPQTVSVHSRSRRYRTRVPAGPPVQAHPDPERYEQIQKALADRGYYKGEANGEWNADSIDAMKRFQADQHLDDDGKITALTLIDLGLGPKHDGSTARLSGPAAPAAAAEIPPEPQEAPPQ